MEREDEETSRMVLQKAKENSLRQIDKQHHIAKANGEDILWGCSLPVNMRNRYFDKVEIRKIIDLRREGIFISKVCDLLGCTKHEINRWDKDGRLPHRFTKKINPGGKMVDARCWLASEVENSVQYIKSWRQQQKIMISFNRRKKPLRVIETTNDHT